MPPPPPTPPPETSKRVRHRPAKVKQGAVEFLSRVQKILPTRQATNLLQLVQDMRIYMHLRPVVNCASSGKHFQIGNDDIKDDGENAADDDDDEEEEEKEEEEEEEEDC